MVRQDTGTPEVPFDWWYVVSMLVLLVAFIVFLVLAMIYA